MDESEKRPTWREPLREAMEKAGDGGPIIHAEGDLDSWSITVILRGEEAGPEHPDSVLFRGGWVRAVMPEPPTAWTASHVYIGDCDDEGLPAGWFHVARRDPPGTPTEREEGK